MKRWAVYPCLFLLACGSGSSGPTGPDTAQIAGTWDYTAANVSPQGLPISCDFNLILTFNQADEVFVGDFAGFIVCEVEGDPDFTLVEGLVLNGTINGNQIAFDLDGPDFHNVGTVSGQTMAGTLTVTIELDSGEEFLLTGPFVAVRD